MIKYIQAIVLFLTIGFLASPQGISFWWGHLLLAIVVLLNLHLLSKYYIFWICLLVTLFTASEPKLSLEYFLIASGCVALALSPWWQNKTSLERQWILGVFFTLFYILDSKDICFYERGSLVLWFPVFLVLYFTKLNRSSTIAYALSGLCLSLSMKRTAVIAYLAAIARFVKIKYLIFIGIGLFAVSFLFVERMSRFVEMSLAPRIVIWGSAIKGWLVKPIWGHGFGNFAIDFPPYREHSSIFAGRMNQQVGHGHGLIPHFLFEQGLFGLALCLIFLYVVYKYARSAFLPVLLIALFDAPLMAFNQYLLAALVLFPFLKEHRFFSKRLNPQLFKFARPLIYLIALVILSTSVIGHYYYSKQSLDNAIRWDPYNPLYHFSRGTWLLNFDTKASELSFKRATELAPGVSYFYGFLAAAELANGHNREADQSVDIALAMDGDEPHWHLIKAFANYGKDRSIFDNHLTLAIQGNPELAKILKDPQATSNAYIGAAGADTRVTSFYRHGPIIHLPLPYFEGEFPEEVKEIIRSAKLLRKS